MTDATRTTTLAGSIDVFRDGAEVKFRTSVAMHWLLSRQRIGHYIPVKSHTDDGVRRTVRDLFRRS